MPVYYLMPPITHTSQRQVYSTVKDGEVSEIHHMSNIMIFVQAEDVVVEGDGNSLTRHRLRSADSHQKQLWLCQHFRSTRCKIVLVSIDVREQLTT